MRVRIQKSAFLCNALAFGLLMLLGACSSNEKLNSELQKTEKNKTLTKKRIKKGKNSLQHIHPSNPCTAAVTHSHSFDNADHQHRYDCENTNEFVSNAHIHPATKKTRQFRHVHPNGAKKHSHHQQ